MGLLVGLGVFLNVGLLVGLGVFLNVGLLVGFLVPDVVASFFVGFAVLGRFVGARVGDLLGFLVGTGVGFFVFAGSVEGESDGAELLESPLPPDVGGLRLSRSTSYRHPCFF